MDKYYCFHGLMSVFVIWTLMPPFFRKKCILKSAGFVALYIILLTIILFWSILFFGFAFWKWMITWSSMRLEFKLSLWPAHFIYVFLFSLADHSYVVVQLGYLSMPTVCITTMHAPTCLDSCRPHFSSDTWPVYATVSS